MVENFLLAFVPIFVAVDAIGVLPIFVSLTQGVKKREKVRIIVQSVITAMCLAVGFIIIGRAVFKLLNITIGDFMIAGGAVLFSISITDIMSPGKQRRIPFRDLGAVPLGIPLIVGPAVLTTSLILIPEYGMAATLISIFLNVALAGIIFSFSDLLIRVFGEAGSKALSKFMSLLLAAIAVMMIRKGILYIFDRGPA